MSDFHHISVLPKETLEAMAPKVGGRYIDCTLGGGGHSALILEAAPDCTLLGLDCDEKALEATEERLTSRFGKRFTARRFNFRELGALLGEAEWGPGSVDGILMDIGVSSHHLDEAERGFSFRQDGPLDMRMDRRLRRTAANIINTESQDELERIFRDYGEEREARRLAHAIVMQRVEKPFSRTRELAELADSVVGRGRRTSPPAPTRCFQALRIAVNGELDALRAALEAAHELLADGGRLCVISFHSLEDRIVKEFFRDKASACTCPPQFPVCCCGKIAEMELLTRKVVEASDAELQDNSRSGCAKLRAAKRLRSSRGTPGPGPRPKSEFESDAPAKTSRRFKK